MASKKPYDLRTLLAAQKAIGVLESLGLKALTADVYLLGAEGHVFMCARGAFYVGDQSLEDRRRIAASLHDDPVSVYERANDYLIQARHYDSRTVDAIERVNQDWIHGDDYHPTTRALGESRSRLLRVKRWIEREIRKARNARKKPVAS